MLHQVNLYIHLHIQSAGSILNGFKVGDKNEKEVLERKVRGQDRHWMERKWEEFHQNPLYAGINFQFYFFKKYKNKKEIVMKIKSSSACAHRALLQPR